MNCEHIREMILADYHDGRLNARKRREIDGHLARCATCRTLSQRVYQQAIKPFNQTASNVPDEFCWSQIKRRIAQEPARAPVPRMDWLLRPALVAASLCVMLFVTGIFLRPRHEQGASYMTYVMADTDTNDEVSSNIETYFL